MSSLRPGSPTERRDIRRVVSEGSPVFEGGSKSTSLNSRPPSGVFCAFSWLCSGSLCWFAALCHLGGLTSAVGSGTPRLLLFLPGLDFLRATIASRSRYRCAVFVVFRWFCSLPSCELGGGGEITVNEGCLLRVCDLKSAFDVANRDVILDQLVDFGVTGNLLGWVREYLRNRTSRVFSRVRAVQFRSSSLALFKATVICPRWSGSVSAPFCMHSGISEGSVLTPHLFSLCEDQLNVMLNTLVLTDHLPFCCAFILCVAGGVNSFPEVRRAAAYSAVRRVGRSTNVMVCTIHSGTRRQWATQLYPHCPLSSCIDTVVREPPIQQDGNLELT
ncbi:hypothetical protein O3P69_015650 [Scylla paramamosain]|uniref:Reverse transcriptase domain-containing protein n=1 Tax=Scylla paramamosain TaxID=85552 RepID=A0AAW0SIA8_SCYPA